MQQNETPPSDKAVGTAFELVKSGRFEEALRAMDAAPDQTDARIAFLRGRVYSAREFSGRDDELAFKYLKEADAAGAAYAKFRMGRLHIERKRINKAVPLFEAASREGDSDASLAMYDICRTHYKDMDVARAYLERAVEQGHPVARPTLAGLKFRGWYGWRQVIPGFVGWIRGVPGLFRYFKENPQD